MTVDAFSAACGDRGTRLRLDHQPNHETKPIAASRPSCGPRFIPAPFPPRSQRNLGSARGRHRRGPRIGTSRRSIFPARLVRGDGVRGSHGPFCSTPRREGLRHRTCQCLPRLAGPPRLPSRKPDAARRKGGEESIRFATHQGRRALGFDTPACILPLPRDRRFEGDAWQQPPFDAIHQAILLVQQRWHNATTDVRGVSPKHEAVVAFAARQLLDIVSPSNCLVTNPEVLARTQRWRITTAVLSCPPACTQRASKSLLTTVPYSSSRRRKAHGASRAARRVRPPQP